MDEVDITELDTLWSIAYVEKIEEDGDILTYAYRFDSEDEADNGIIQFDRYVLEEIDKETKYSKIIDMFISKRINIIRPCINERMSIEDFDIGAEQALRIILNSYFVDGDIPNVMELLNAKAIKRMKYTYPEGYEELIKIIEEETKRLT